MFLLLCEYRPSLDNNTVNPPTSSSGKLFSPRPSPRLLPNIDCATNSSNKQQFSLSRNNSHNNSLFNVTASTSPVIPNPSSSSKKNNPIQSPMMILESCGGNESTIVMMPSIMRPSSSSGANNSSSSGGVHITPRRSFIIDTSHNNASSNNNPTIILNNNTPPNGMLFDESPRVTIPEKRIFEGWSSHDRPKSAEKRRWLARANLLREGNVKVANLAEEDDLASQLAFDTHDNYFHIEYLEWMGKEIFHSIYDHGDILCPNCKHIVGSWTWKPSQR